MLHSRKLQGISQMSRWFVNLILLISLLIGMTGCNSNQTQEMIPSVVEENAQETKKVEISPDMYGASSIVVKINPDGIMKQANNKYLVYLSRVGMNSEISIYEHMSIESQISLGTIDVGHSTEIVLSIPQFPLGDSITGDSLAVYQIKMKNMDCIAAYDQLVQCSINPLTSLVWEPQSYKLTGGNLLVWAADDQQEFPINYGADGVLFNDDDDVTNLQMGYTLVNLNVIPFEFVRTDEAIVSVTQTNLYPLRDLQSLSYSQAFEQMFNDMKTHYAFQSIVEKQPDWDNLYSSYMEKIQIAEENVSSTSYAQILINFANEFSDDNVVVSGDAVSDIRKTYFNTGFGFSVTANEEGELFIKSINGDNENVLFAENAYRGMKILSIDGEPAGEVLAAQMPFDGPFSNDALTLAAQIDELTRAKNGSGVMFEFETPNGDSWRNRLFAYEDNLLENHVEGKESKLWPYDYYNCQYNIGCVDVFNAGASYELSRDLFENMLKDFKANHFDTILIDLRGLDKAEYSNYAGFFTETRLKLGNITLPGIGRDEGDLSYEVSIIPEQTIYSFENIIVLVDRFCKNACEVDAYALGLLPNSKVFGETSTEGSTAIVMNQPYAIPEGLLFNFPVGYYTNEDGIVLLEGKGLTPDVVTPNTLGMNLSSPNALFPLSAADVLFNIDSVADAEISPNNVKIDNRESEDIVYSLINYDLGRMAIETYPQSVAGNTHTYTVVLDDPREIFVTTKWCAVSSNNVWEIVNKENINFTIDGKLIPDEYSFYKPIYEDGLNCTYIIAATDGWGPGKHHVVIESTVNNEMSDGRYYFPEGIYTEEYTVVVRDTK